MASVQTYKNGHIKIVDDDKIVLELIPRRTESGKPAATVMVDGKQYQLYERSLIALTQVLQKVISDGNTR